MTSYCTLAQAKAELKATSTIDDEKLRNYIRIVSSRIDLVMNGSRKARPFFAPYIEQRRRNITGLRVNSYDNSFLLGYNILSISEVLAGTNNITANVELYDANNEVPNALRITNNATTWYSACSSSSNTPPYVLKVTGSWGWHDDYANAWDSVDTLASGITASATTLTVVDIDGVDGNNYTPRISAGNLIRIDDEMMDVLSTDTTTQIATVKRGVNGSTAAAHDAAKAVEVFQVDDRIMRIATRQAALLYARRGAFQVETLDGVGVVTYPQDLLNELDGVLQGFMYV